jgi:DEAD/DEAH box helicase domain-containing protein
MHFMGSIHALEHAAIGILPLLVMADRNDFGGLSTPMHPQTGRPTVFVYDGMPGGAGLSRAAFSRAGELFRHVRQVMADCPCELGCPSCVHSPKCGSGNRPIDKEGALALLEAMLEDTEKNRGEAEDILASPPGGLEEEATGEERDPLPVVAPDFSSVPGGAGDPPPNPPLPEEAGRPPCPDADARIDIPREAGAGGENALRERKRESAAHPPDMVVLDVETRLSAAEAGGWHKAARMGVSVAVLYDSRTDSFRSYTQDRVPELARALAAAPLVVGFNLLRFDYAVLEPHAPEFSFRKLPTVDLLLKIYEQLSYRVSLDNLARATLNAPKSADGLTALQWWKEQRLAEIEEYCRRDVALTRDLYRFGRENGYLLFTNKAGQSVRVRAEW